MGLKEQLMNDLKAAMLQRDNDRKQTIRSIIAATKKAETTLNAAGQRVKLDDNGILAIIHKQAKMRQESIDAFRAGGREDLVAQEEVELAILKEYLPKQLGAEDIEKEARLIIAEVGASGPRDIGKVMKPLMAKFRGKVDGGQVNQIVRQLLVG
jgi:uncharacterized protein YqeY